MTSTNARLSPRRRERAVLLAFVIVFTVAGALGGLAALI